MVHLDTQQEQGRLGLGLVVVPCGPQFTSLMVEVGVVGVGLVGAPQALVGVDGAVVVVRCQPALGVPVVEGGQELVLVGALPSNCIRGMSFSFS